jgi:hypothetical protein
MTDEERKDYWRVRRNIYNQVRRKVLAQVYPQYPKRYRPEPTEEHLAMIRERFEKTLASQQKSLQRRKISLRTVLAPRRKEAEEIVRDWKVAGCVTCGEYCLACLDAHHVGEKRHDISRLMKSTNLELLREELGRCVVLCANCHRKHHAGLLALPEGTYPN